MNSENVYNCVYCNCNFPSKTTLNTHTFRCIWLHSNKNDISQSISMTLPLGAINKTTNEYVCPKEASKNDKYICCECNKELILCRGKKRVHHFRHKVDNVNPCHYYSNPSESQIHKDAKQQLKTILEKQLLISFNRVCRCCKKNEEYEIPEISASSSIVLEHRFQHDGTKIADIAYLDNEEIVCIFEIRHTHKTLSEHRPEPWFEIDARALLRTINSSQNQIKLYCIRDELCEECKEKNICEGKGMCLMQTNNTHNYAKNRDIQCNFNCKLIKCQGEYCKEQHPQWYFDCHNGLCLSCDMGFEPERPVYLDVPYNRKEQAKRLGARWSKHYRMWYVYNTWECSCKVLENFDEKNPYNENTPGWCYS